MKKTYIEEAQEVYNNIVGCKIESYKFFVLQTLNGYGIKNIEQLSILKRVLSVNESSILQFSFPENKDFDFSFKDDGKSKKYDKEKKSFFVDLSQDQRFEQEMTNIPGQYSIIAALRIWEEKKKQNKVEGQELQKDTFSDEDLAALLKRSFGEFCVAYTYMHNKTDFYSYCDAITFLFFTYLWKSVAVGEFYIVSGYKDIIRAWEDKKDDLDERILPAFINCYSDISSAIATFVNRINPKNNGGLYEVHFELDQDLIIDSIPGKYVKTEHLQPLIKLTQLLFDITVIDIRYIASESNLSKLINFIYAFDKLKKSLSPTKATLARRTSIFLEQAFDVNALEILNNVIEALIFKACVLSKQMMEQQAPAGPKICFGYSPLTNPEINSIIEQYSQYAKDYTKDIFYVLYKHDSKNDISTQDKFQDDLKNCRKDNSRYPECSLIKKYNENIDEGVSAYITNNRLYYLIKNNADPQSIIQGIESFVQEHSDITAFKCVSPSTLVKSILWLYNYLKNSVNREHRVIYTYGKLLNCLRLFIIAYKNEKDAPRRFRSYFEYSYCSVEDKKVIKVYLSPAELQNYDREQTKQYIFFASQGYSPVNMQFLENFFLKYNREFRTFEGDAIEDSIKKSEELSGKITGAIATIKEERGRTLQLVGLLGTFIAFVSSLVGTQKVAIDIFDFMLFFITFMTGILVFVFCVYNIANPDKESVWKLQNFKNPYFITLLLLILAMAILVCIRPSKANTNHIPLETIQKARKTDIEVYEDSSSQHVYHIQKQIDKKSTNASSDTTLSSKKGIVDSLP
jgi:hypothetical protein